MSAHTAESLLPVRPVVLCWDEDLATRAAASGADASGTASEAPGTPAEESPESGAVTGGRLLGLLGSAAFAGWTSVTCFVC